MPRKTILTVSTLLTFVGCVNSEVRTSDASGGVPVDNRGQPGSGFDPQSEFNSRPATGDNLRNGLTPSQGFFTDRSEVIEGNSALRRYGIAMSDQDGDGDMEAIIAGYGSANQVLDWRGGRVVDIATQTIADADRKAIGVAACDVDADGKEEIYLLNIDRFGGLGSVADRLLDETEEGWQDLFERPDNASRLNEFSGRSVACLDRNGDGRYGVFVANYGGPMKLFEVGDDARLVDVAASSGVGLTTGGRSLLSIPLNGVSGMHLFAGNENGPNFLFKNSGDGTFAEIAALVGVTDASETVRGTTTLDADGDGDFDLLYGNWEGPNRLFLAEGEGDTIQFVEQTPLVLKRPSKIRTVIAADFDNDGHEEVFWNNIGQPNRLVGWRGGEWISLPIGDALESEGLGTGAAVGDMDGDGKLELIVSHGESGAQPLSLYVTAPNSNNWLRVMPLTVHGAPARGATVTLTDSSGRTQVRAIDAGSGYLCQMEPVAHFGLGDVDSVTNVTVVWPGGQERVLSDPAVNQRLVLSP